MHLLPLEKWLLSKHQPVNLEKEAASCRPHDGATFSSGAQVWLQNFHMICMPRVPHNFLQATGRPYICVKA